MRRWSKAAVPALLLLLPASGRAQTRVYDPDVALLLINVQKASVDLVAQEMLRQADWLGLGAMEVLLPARMGRFEAEVRSRLTVDSDVVDLYRQAIVDMSPAAAGEADALAAEVRRYHDLRPGPPLVRVPLPPIAGRGPKLLEESGPGADVTAAIEGTPLLDAPVAYAERRFGSTGPFLRRRKWNLDFYLGSFYDLIPHYRRLGYRRVYRLRAPYISFGKSAYVLAPEIGLRPRLVYCGFDGQDFFLDVRAQWAVLTRMARGRGPIVTTLTCPSCRWSLPGVDALEDLLGTVPYQADYVVAGYPRLVADAWRDRRLGVYQNAYWRLSYYRSPAGPVALVEARHTDFGEIMAAALDVFVRRGARGVFYAGPAALVAEKAPLDSLAFPTRFIAYQGRTIAFRNAFAKRRHAALFAELPSPLLATREWLAGARTHGVLAVDDVMERIAEAAEQWPEADGRPVVVGLGAVLGGLTALHPEEDRTLYAPDSDTALGDPRAQAQYVRALDKALKAAARDRSR
ncbi:MAG: hypothetical protein KGM24_02700 [Elusimicrobia bacterium]|nr:hypothetical protein [Elusimicrobiota bacterium]